MKKILTLVILILTLSLTLAGCGGTTPPGSSWADKETLVYDVFNGEQAVGTLTATLERDPEDTTIDGTEYSKATSKLTINYTFNDESINIESLLNDFTPLATSKVVSTTNKEYTLNSYYKGKYYHYNLENNGNKKSGRMKVKGEVIDNDLLYTYLRCQNLENGLNKTLAIPDATTGSLQSYSANAVGTENILVPFPDGEKTVAAYKIKISRTSSPIGESIFIYYSPNTTEATITGGLTSLNDSRKIPLKIVENNMTYILKSITVA